MNHTRAVNATPRHFWIMIICVLGFGVWAGNAVLPVLLFTTPVLAFLLVRVQLRETRERMFDQESGLHKLPTAAQRQVKAALQQLSDGEVRDLLLGIVRVGANAWHALPRDYAESDYGRTIEELIGAAADTAVHTASFGHTLQEIEAQPSSVVQESFDLLDAAEKVRGARDARIDQLSMVLRVLSEIGPDIAEAGDAGTRRIVELLESLKGEASRHDAAETEIAALLK